ncbi:ribosome small subunit-dependent GTPase A [Antrihabitans cavernicola]|uniref:Small ribosomal subunit biogenesis GTPase RsgA n=1 Tax=Antrihabitans cavernicola TaxID=2495913 RepID=A0A5A7SJK3_9NOCA|nr:ribosome small subunit-dependent GTPase A [Spelaeibacter cavernicola]KAA0024605.1 ribosome small subunit-dependent GTPase A [Spelaeibacter cavernicola]
MVHPLDRYGWNDSVATSFASYPDTPARIVRVDKGQCDAATSGGVVRARTADRQLCTGDWVTVADRGDAPTVIDLLPRTTAIRRSSSPRSEAQMLAANVDTVLVTTALDGDVDLARIERLLALAWESGAQPVIALTKADAAQHVLDRIARVQTIAPGVSVLAVSATTGDGIDILIAVLSGTVALIGPSGAGKSTLANTLLGKELLATNAVRSVDGKGRHTTVHRELLPLPFGGALIDTPGLRGVGLWDAAHGIEKVFADVDTLAHQCRFDDCHHVAEPGCAVLAAVESGTLEQRRLDSYRKLLRENDWVAARSDARLRSERTRVVKSKSRELRRMYKSR